VARPDATVVGMSTTGLPQRCPASVEFVDLSDAADAYALDPAWLSDGRRRMLLAALRDDALCGQARATAAQRGERLWRELLSRAGPPDDVGPALMLAYSLDACGAAAEARHVVERVLRPGTYRRRALELAMELAQDAGDAARAWELLRLLGVDRRLPRYSTLRCLVSCTPDHGCAAAGRQGIVRSRWLWQRARDWVSAPSSDLRLGEAERQLLLAEGSPLADIVRADGALLGIGPMSQGLFAYLRCRWRLLSETERGLVLRWLRTQRRPYSVAAVHENEMVLVDAYGRHHLAGTEHGPVDSGWRLDDMVSGWLLPTCAPDEHLLILDTAAVAPSP
jgi:hypothetical protein